MRKQTLWVTELKAVPNAPSLVDITFEEQNFHGMYPAVSLKTRMTSLETADIRIGDLFEMTLIPEGGDD
jgi:hypothetical protein